MKYYMILLSLVMALSSCDEASNSNGDRETETNKILKICDSADYYKRRGRTVKEVVASDYSDNRAPQKALFKLDKSDQVPAFPVEERLSESEVKSDIVGAISLLKPFEAIQTEDVISYKRWFADCKSGQVRAIYFTLKSGDRYFFIRTYQ